jgi:hypothetical protein
MECGDMLEKALQKVVEAFAQNNLGRVMGEMRREMSDGIA